MKNFVFVIFVLPLYIFGQITSPYEAFGELHNNICIKLISSKNSEKYIKYKYPNEYSLCLEISDDEIRKHLIASFPNTESYLNIIDSVIYLSVDVEEDIFIKMWQETLDKIASSTELSNIPKQMLLYMLYIVKHSRTLWKQMFPNDKIRTIIKADAYGALKGILAGLLFFGLYDLSRMPTKIGIWGGVGIAVFITALSSTISAIKYEQGTASGTEWYY